jgi:tetratricopeptide (TPR) repeat protein|tara:strand:+ start:9911 stop:11608 length:1698 start_codon:yes stop_codon:yes gene_type:complete
VLDINKMTKMIKLIVVLYLSAMSINNAIAQSSVKPSITEANAEFVYKYLLGEIAGQRGDLSLASQLFLDLAKKTRDPRLAERAAKTAAYGRQQRLALDAATLWAELDPSSLEAQQATSQMMISTGDIQSAVPHIKELLSKEESRAATFLYLNDLLRNQKDKKAVLTTIKELAQPYPASAEAHFAVAEAAWFAQDMDAAESAIKQASQLRPDWEVSAQMQGQILAKKFPEKAVDFYKSFLNKNPTANNLRIDYAKLLVRLKRYEEAKPEFIKLTEFEKDNPDTNAVVGLLSLEANELDMAEQYLQQSMRNGFKDPEKIYMYLGITADRKENKSKALEWYGKIDKSNQHYLEAQLATASIIAQTKNTDAAISMLDNLAELTAVQEIVVAQAQASLLVQDKRHQEAFELIKKTINTIPNTPQLIYDYAMAAERIGKLDLMENELRKVIQLQPDFSAAYNALGYSFADRNINLKEAKTLIETAQKLSPSDHYILDSLGWVEYRLGNYAVAVEHLRKAYSVQEDPEISAHLGEVLWKQGLQEEAKNIWGKALKAFPENSTLVSTYKKFNS